MTTRMKIIYRGTDGQNKAIILGPDKPTAVIGQSPDCEIQTDCAEVSSIHAKLEWDNGRVFIMYPPGTTPTNALKVDGMRLRINERLEVFVGTQLAVGTFYAQVYEVDAEMDANPLQNLYPGDSIMVGYGPQPSNYDPSIGENKMRPHLGQPILGQSERHKLTPCIGQSVSSPQPNCNTLPPLIYGPPPSFNKFINCEFPASQMGRPIGIYGPPPGIYGQPIPKDKEDKE